MRIPSVILFILLSTATLFASTIGAPKGFDGEVFANTLSLYGGMNDAVRHLCTIAPYEKTSSGYLLITAGHCVQENSAELKFYVSASGERGSLLLPVTLVKVRFDETFDFAVFDLTTAEPYHLAEFSDLSDVAVGDGVTVVHFAKGLAKQLSHGVVASRQVLTCKHGCAEAFLIQMYAGAGSSGALVYSTRTHKVIGVTQAEFDEPLGFMIEPITKFAAFMALPTQPHPVEPEEN